MAGHAWGGIELHQALRRGEPLRFLQLLNDQDKWPFGFSLLLLPFLALGDDGFAAATLLSTALFAATPALLLWAAREVDDGLAGWWGGGLAALLFLASPLLRLFAVLIMREEAGCFLSLLALCCYLRARRRGDERSWRWAGLAGLALFLVKYNYAVIWGMTAAASELLRLAPERREALLRRAGRWLWPWWREKRQAEGRASRSAAGIALYLYAPVRPWRCCASTPATRSMPACWRRRAGGYGDCRSGGAIPRRGHGSWPAGGGCLPPAAPCSPPSSSRSGSGSCRRSPSTRSRSGLSCTTARPARRSSRCAPSSSTPGRSSTPINRRRSPRRGRPWRCWRSP